LVSPPDNPAFPVPDKAVNINGVKEFHAVEKGSLFHPDSKVKGNVFPAPRVSRSQQGFRDYPYLGGNAFLPHMIHYYLYFPDLIIPVGGGFRVGCPEPASRTGGAGGQ
jgi:hypothetical protein